MSKEKGHREKLPALLNSWLPWLFFGCAAFLWPLSTAWAALDPETDKPYQLQLVLRIPESRVLTPIFREVVQRQLQDSLQAALGDLARVQIVHDHPLLKEIEAKGLQAALDNYAVLSDVKTHFVLIDFVDGRYQIQTRQHDGFTGLSSPVVRHSATADRLLVARLAALLIDQDFGLAGTVDLDRLERGKTDTRVAIRLKGGSLGVPLDRWVQKDQVFAVAQIPEGGAPRHSLRRSWTLLQATEAPHGAVCRCRLLSRWEDPLPRAPDIVGYRCLKLGTTRAPLRLRVVRDDRLKTAINGVQVLISQHSFSETSVEQTTTKPDGLVQSQEAYQHIAFVRIYDGPVNLARAPVEIIEALTITCPVSVDPELAAQGEWLERRRRWLQRLVDSLDVAAHLARELNAMAGQSSESRLARAQEGLKVLQAAISNLTTERDALRAAGAGDSAKATPLDLTEGDKRLEELQTERDDLQQYIGRLQEIIQKEKDPQRRRWQDLLAQAAHLERDADFDKALQLYEQVLSQSGDNAELRRYVDALQRDWAAKNEAHAQARRFIYETWPKLRTAAQMKARLQEARQAFQTCKNAGDRLSPRKLLKTFVDHTARLDQEVDALHPEQKEDDRKTAETIIALTDELKKFNDEVKDYVAKAKAAGK